MFNDLFEVMYVNRALEIISRLPKEVVAGGVAAYVVINVHNTHCQTKVTVAEAQARKAEAELELEKLKHSVDG